VPEKKIVLKDQPNSKILYVELRGGDAILYGYGRACLYIVFEDCGEWTDVHMFILYSGYEKCEGILDLVDTADKLVDVLEAVAERVTFKWEVERKAILM